jgi:hypothetical protein
MTDELLYTMLVSWSDSEFALAASGEFAEDLKALIEGTLAKQADRLKALTAENEKLRERMSALDQQAETLGGCGNAYCVIHRPKGQHTNGGCYCYENRAKMRVWTQQVAYFRSKVRAALEKQP